MSLGNTYNNNQTNKTYEFGMYSNYRMNNAESKIDATCISFRYWRTNLCISIYPRKNTGNDEISFDTENGITIYLSHTKARMLKNEIEHFLEDPIKYNSCGVNSGSSVITISNGSEYGKDTPIITIRKVNEEGEVTSSFAYEFKRDYHFSIRNYDGKEFDRLYDEYNNIEIMQLVTLLDEYCKASTNAVAFSVMNQHVYAVARLDNKIDAIANSLGVDIAKSGGGNNRKYNNNTYFNKNKDSGSDSNYGSASIDDLE